MVCCPPLLSCLASIIYGTHCTCCCCCCCRLKTCVTQLHFLRCAGGSAIKQGELLVVVCVCAGPGAGPGSVRPPRGPQLHGAHSDTASNLACPAGTPPLPLPAPGPWPRPLPLALPLSPGPCPFPCRSTLLLGPGPCPCPWPLPLPLAPVKPAASLVLSNVQTDCVH